MKIIIRSSDGHHFTIPFPTALLTSPTALRFELNASRKHIAMPPVNIPPEAVSALCRSIRQCTKAHSPWELVHVESANGDLVSIIL